MHRSTFRFNFLLVYQLKIYRGNSYEPPFVQNTTTLFFDRKNSNLGKTSSFTENKCYFCDAMSTRADGTSTKHPPSSSPLPRCIPPRPLTALSQQRKAFSLFHGTQSLPQASPPSFPCPSTPHLMVKPSVRQEAGSAFAKRHLSGTREPRARSLANRGSAEHQDKPELSSPA